MAARKQRGSSEMAARFLHSGQIDRRTDKETGMALIIVKTT